MMLAIPQQTFKEMDYSSDYSGWPKASMWPERDETFGN